MKIVEKSFWSSNGSERLGQKAKRKGAEEVCKFLKIHPCFEFCDRSLH